MTQSTLQHIVNIFAEPTDPNVPKLYLPLCWWFHIIANVIQAHVYTRCEPNKYVKIKNRNAFLVANRLSISKYILSASSNLLK